jgi:hypothetical protein
LPAKRWRIVAVDVETHARYSPGSLLAAASSLHVTSSRAASVRISEVGVTNA